MTIRFVPFRYYTPYFKTGLNQALIDSVSETRQETVFLAGWDRDTVNVGYGQKVKEEVDLEEAEKRDITIVRRQGGGGTTFLTRKGEITWGIVAPEENYPEDVNKIYRQVCGKIADGLEEIGIDARHEPINDIVTEKGKISGATVKRKNSAIYIGGTLLYRVDPEKMFSVLTPAEDKLKDKQIQDYKERVSSVSEETEASFEETVSALKNALLKNKRWKEDSFTDSEKERASRLADKYSSDEWLYRND